MTEEVEKKECECEVEKWLLDVTQKDNLDLAKADVRQALEVRAAIPHMGVLSILVGPGGLMNLTATQNLFNPDDLENVEMALLDAQRETMRSRKQLSDQLKVAPPMTELDPEKVEEKPERKRIRGPIVKKADAKKEQAPAEES